MTLFITTSAFSFAGEETENATPAVQTRRVPLVVPNYLVDQDFGQASHTFTDAVRVQQVYSASEFPAGPIKIRGFYWRPCADTNFGADFHAIIPNFQLNLSTTSKQPDQLSSTFTDNIGPDESVAFQGKLTVSSHFVDGPGNTKQFDIYVRLKHPFIYDPANGNLLVDIRHDPAPSATYVSEYGADDGGSRAVALDPSATTASFTDTGIDVIKVAYSPVHHRRAQAAVKAQASDNK